jgi:SAM-dependent methyltransferase
VSAGRAYYEKKDGDYYGSVRRDILPLLPDRLGRVMEIGCGTGNTLRYLKESGRCDWTCGVELFHDAAKQAREKLDLVVEGDIEAMDLPVEPDSLDAILCLDVLEHLTDPWSTLKELVVFLKPGGVLVLSIPNIREIKTLYGLVVRGTFEYDDEGVLDRTHLRFFCKRNIVDLVRQANLKLGVIHRLLGRKRRILNALTLGIFKDFLAVQYVIAAKK